MILLVSNERDLTTDYIVLELKRRGLKYFRLNTEHFSEEQISFNPKNGEDGWVVKTPNNEIKFTEITAAYFRRPGTPNISKEITDLSARNYCEKEWNNALGSALNSLDKRWFNSPISIQYAENKPRQLAIAYDIGLSIPDTIITNDPEQAQTAFLNETNVVAKPLREALLENNNDERVIFTNKVDKIDKSNYSSIRLAPVIFQQKIKKHVDIRTTVIGDKVYSVEIHSQEHGETKVDWRRGARPDLIHKQHTLPSEISDKCIQLVNKLQLRYGAIDFVLDENGNYWFLEVNPNGQWAWLENRVEIPLSQTIVDELERISHCSKK